MMMDSRTWDTLQSATPERQLAWLMANPVRFARGLLRHRLWDQQVKILMALGTRRHARVAVKACHASSKTFTAAEAVLWWTTRFTDGLVVTTAPTWTQVERVLWAEIHKAAGNSRINYPSLFKTELKLGPDNYAIGLSTNEGVRFQGFHGRVLVVLDEAPGVQPEIWEAIEGIRASGDVRELALGNPVLASGPFYDIFAGQRAQWATFTISAFDTPNFRGVDLARLCAMTDFELDTNATPYLATRRWVREKFHEWGEGHPLWQARVLGEFPTQAEDALISLAWLEHARTRVVVGEGGYTAGVDVAGPGEDETVVVVRRGEQLIALAAFTQADPRGSVLAMLAPYKAEGLTVNVDAIGIGYNFGLHLQDCGHTVKLINVGEAARDKEKFKNAKAEYYWGLRERFEAGEVGGLTDERTIAQLAGLRYEHTARGQVLIESKEDARKRGVKSPDRAEAVMLAFAAPRHAASEARVVGW